MIVSFLIPGPALRNNAHTLVYADHRAILQFDVIHLYELRLLEILERKRKTGVAFVLEFIEVVNSSAIEDRDQRSVTRFPEYKFVAPVARFRLTRIELPRYDLVLFAA